MKRTGRIVLFGLFVVLLGGLGWLALPPHDPLFHGKSESEWITNIVYGMTLSEDQNREQTQRWRDFGPEGLRVLERGLAKAHRGRAYRKLYRHLSVKLPGELVHLLPAPGMDTQSGTRMLVLDLLRRMGKDAWPAWPAVARALEDENSHVRQVAITFFTHPEDDTAILNQMPAPDKRRLLPLFIRALEDRTANWGLRNNAALALRYYPDRHNDDVSVDFSDPQRRTLLAGGHEQSRTVWKSVDGGQTWTNVGATLPAGTKFSSNPLLIDASTYLVNASGWGKGTGGVYRTTNGGAAWTQASELEANGAPLSASDRSIYWQLMYDRGVIRSTNQGQTWTRVCGPGVIKGAKIIELPDGQLAAVAGKSVKVSSDRGVSWTPVLEPTPIQPAGVIYAPARQAFYIWQWDCGNKVLTNAMWRHDYRVETKPPR